MANELSLWAGLGPKPKTALRQYERHGAGLKYSDAERKAWSYAQVAAAKARAAQATQLNAEVKPPVKRQSRAKSLEADTSGSTCFDSLTFKSGVVTASFSNPTRGEWSYEMSRADAKEWFDDASLGGFFNDNIR
jgi:hypothetical protein